MAGRAASNQSRSEVVVLVGILARTLVAGRAASNQSRSEVVVLVGVLSINPVKSSIVHMSYREAPSIWMGRRASACGPVSRFQQVTDARCCAACGAIKS